MEEQRITKKERKELRRRERMGVRDRRHRNRVIRRVILWGGLILGAGGIIVIATISSSQNPATGEPLSPSSLELLSLRPDDHVQGNREAKVTFVEYSDFQCPACASYRPFFQQAAVDFGANARFAYRHFPLRPIHKNAELAARAAEAAGNQGKFWEMHDTIFEHQDDWANDPRAQDVFIRYAGELGIEKSVFEADLESSGVREKVERDLGGGELLGVNATPTFFLNGEKIQNPRTYEDFRSSIQKAIEENF